MSQEFLLDRSSTIIETRSMTCLDAPQEVAWDLEPGEEEIRMLLAKLRLGCAPVQRISIWKIANLTINVKNHDLIASSGSIFALVSSIRADCLVRADGLRALASLTCSEAICVELVEVRGVEVVLEAAQRESDFHVLHHSMAILVNLCKHKASAEVVIMGGGCKILLDAIRRNGSKDHVALEALVSLSEEPEGQLEISRCDGVKTVANMLAMSPSVSMKCCLLRLIKNLAVEICSGDNSAGGYCMFQLVQLLKSGDDKVTELALDGIAHLSMDKRMRVLFTQEGGIKHLVTLLQSSSQECIAAAVEALRVLSRCDMMAVAIARKGGIKELSRLIRQEGFLRAVMPLANLADIEANQQRIISEGGISLFLSSAQRTSPGQIRIASLGGLSALSKNGLAHSSFMESHIMQDLVGFLKPVSNNDEEIATVACCIISRLCERWKGKKLARQAGVVSHVLPILERGNSENKKLASCVLAQVSPGKQFGTLLAKYDQILPLFNKKINSVKLVDSVPLGCDIFGRIIPPAIREFVVGVAYKGPSLCSIVVRFFNKIFPFLQVL